MGWRLGLLSLNLVIIEKEAIYKRLLEEKINEKIGPCILITGILKSIS